MSKGKFVDKMKRLAKLRSGKLQVGNVKTNKAGLDKEKASFKSGVTGGPGLGVQATEGQTALNPKQRGASSKNEQKSNTPKR